MASRNELIELYDSLSVLYNSLPAETDPEWELALKHMIENGGVGTVSKVRSPQF